MSSGFTIATAACVGVMALLLLVDLVRGRRRRGGVGLVLLAAVVVALYATTGFPFPSSDRQAFGEAFPTWGAVALMFGGVVLGMVGHYVWQRPERFSWIELLRPLVASPIVLLPLIGSLDGGALNPIQLVSLALLAFQNGFFWPRVLQDAKPTGS